ncbi:hypothetical protein [Planomicrobium sp. CPCC 101079]|uniref:hypothetical protein n=1 Tax=Planomicrobium sp. CPCC 101079 TaxID=2599618 RepID=UPI0011B73BF2|nr:hypothetical protein [Planomicrobium sp. CPCC 101079]TWT04625.1 hypothetical protein FQV28_08460 [Planomicrobium sp. CPCC 101079]
MRVDVKKAIKARRLQLLFQIDQLNPYRCQECAACTIKVNCQCPAAIKIRAIGDQINALPNPKREERIASLVAQGKVYLTPRIYFELREAELINREIAHKIGWSISKLQKWKSDKGLADERLSAVRKAQMAKQREKEVAQ